MMRFSIVVAALSTMIAGCAVSPANLDPDTFREKAELTYSKTIELPADITASNIDKAGTKCWESGNIRTKQFKEATRYVITIGSYGDLTKSLLIMADVTPINEKSSEAKIYLLRKGHKEFGDNLLEWAAGTTKTCHSPMNRKK